MGRSLVCGEVISVWGGPLVCVEVHWCVEVITVWGGPLVCGEVHYCVGRSISVWGGH